jgi:heme/copper-type cytochrome/quinol oxidase subunit 2
MKRFLSPVSAYALALFLGAAVPLIASAATAPPVITVTASATSLFTPTLLTVRAGQPVELKIIGESGVHAIQSSELGIPNTTILPHTTKVVTFTPAEAGTYIVRCGIPCGPDHDKMAFTIKVV